MILLGILPVVPATIKQSSLRPNSEDASGVIWEIGVPGAKTVGGKTTPNSYMKTNKFNPLFMQEEV